LGHGGWIRDKKGHSRVDRGPKFCGFIDTVLALVDGAKVRPPASQTGAT